MSTRTQVWFGDTELTSHAVVSGWDTPLLPREVSQRTAPAMDGTIYTGARLTERQITVRMALRGGTPAERQGHARAIAAALRTDGPTQLRCSIDGGLWYLAVANSDSDMTRMVVALAFDVTFTCTDPVSYGTQRTVAVPSGGSATFEVGGTYPTMPTVDAPEAANGSGGFWALTLEDGTHLDATVPDGLESAPVEADCEARTLTVNGDLAMLQPNADWLRLAPGEHTLTMAGTGAATVTFWERWL